MAMNPQIFTINVDKSQKANYNIIIPVKNYDDSCKLEIRDLNNSIIKFNKGGENEFILQRNDIVGEYHFKISLYNNNNSGDLYDLQNIIVNVLDSPSEVDTSLLEKNRQVVLDYIKQVTIESGMGMYGPSMSAQNMPAVWRKLNQQLNSQEIDALCKILGEANDFKVNWIALNFMNYSSQDIIDNELLMRVLNTAGDHIPDGGFVQTIGLQLIQSLNLPKTAIWKALFSALRVTAPNLTLPIIRVIKSFVPQEGIKPTTNAIIRLIRSFNADSYEILQCLETLEAIDNGDTAEALKDILARPVNAQASAKIAALFAKWNYNEASVAIRDYLKANHATVEQLYILETMSILFRIEGQSSVKFISELLPRCRPYVQKEIGSSNYMGELKYNPEILLTIKDISAKTNDPDVKKALSAFIEKTPPNK